MARSLLWFQSLPKEIKNVLYGSDMSMIETECFVFGSGGSSRKKGDDDGDDEEKKA